MGNNPKLNTIYAYIILIKYIILNTDDVNKTAITT